MGAILVTGSNGQLGSELKNHLKKLSKIVFFTDIDELDICNIQSVREFVTKSDIDIIINCAAYTAVDKAEEDSLTAMRVNGQAPGILATVARESESLLIHISTDYVFDGNSHLPYKEDDIVSPTSVYGQTKLAGELAVQNSGCRFIIIRTSWLYSSFGNNFVKTILRLASEKESLNVVFDQVGTPTYAADLARSIYEIILQYNHSNNTNEKINEVFHFSDEGVCSWYDFAKEIVSYQEMDCKILPVTSDKFPSKTKRPSYSVLDKGKIKATFGLEIPHWRSSLICCLNILNKL
jgi:dTDP-4-dehydrorhamnose reductase